MMRYRSARIVPGVYPPTGIESEEMWRAGAAEAAERELPDNRVGTCENEPTSHPQAEQKRLSSEMEAEHDGH